MRSKGAATQRPPSLAGAPSVVDRGRARRGAVALTFARSSLILAARPTSEVNVASQLFARKPLALLLEELKSDNRLRRALGPIQLTSLGVGAIIGTGIF